MRDSAAALIRAGVLVAVFSLVVSVAEPADAYFTFNDHSMLGGIYLRHFYIDSTATGAVDAAAIEEARTVWDNTPTKFVFSQQYSAPNAATVFHHNSGPSGIFCAITYMYSQGSVDPTQVDWAWASIHIDPAITDAAACGIQSDRHRGAIIAHEWGHAIGLAHNPNDATTLMYPGISGTNVPGPTLDEDHGAVYLYGACC